MNVKKKELVPGLGRLWRHGFITMAAFVISGCGITPRTENPIPTIWPTSDERKNKTLIVMLPGRGDRAENFRAAGFPDTLKDKAFDAVLVDAHFGYYKDRSLLPRLHNDVIIPAKESGYENIWLLGVSMGGMGSLLYVNEHPALIDGVILLAPYLGDPGLSTEVEASGGLAAWSAEGSSFMEHEVAIWDWLKNTRTGEEKVPVYLGYGLSDRLADSYGALQGDIAGLHVYTEDGGHKWTTWTRLWSRIASDLAHDTQ